MCFAAKDSASPRRLLTTVNESANRVAMHAVRTELLQAQAETAGLPLMCVPIPHPCTNEVYEARMSAAIANAKAKDSPTLRSAICFLKTFAAIAKSG